LLTHIKQQSCQGAFLSVDGGLQAINIFHTDRGKELDNQLINDVIAGYDIDRSLGKKGCPYDKAVAEATYKGFLEMC